MGGNNPKPSAATLDKLKDALSDLQGLQSDWGSYSSLGKLKTINDLSPDGIENLLNNAGHNYNRYYGTRAGAVSSAVDAVKSGLDTLVTLLDATVKKYDTNEQNNQDAADNTGGNNSAGNDGKG